MIFFPLLGLSVVFVAPLVGAATAMLLALVTIGSVSLNRRLTRAQLQNQEASTFETLSRSVYENAQRMVQLQTDVLKQTTANIALERRISELEKRLAIETEDKRLALTERDRIHQELNLMKTEAETAQLSLRQELERALEKVHQTGQQLIEREERILALERQMAELTATGTPSDTTT